MYQPGQLVMYGFHGVCRVREVQERMVDRVRRQYLVLEPACRGSGQFLVPMHNAAALGKISQLLSRQELTELLSSQGVHTFTWVPDENRRKQRYRELTAACSELTVMTDDGSNGSKGFVTQALQKKLEAGEAYDEVIAIGPLPMMRAVCELTKPYGTKTIVSMNPIMIDGTGMCGGCRVTVGGVTKFACVDGPDFDGHLIDWDEAIARSRMFRPEEAQAKEKLHQCRREAMIENAVKGGA